MIEKSYDAKKTGIRVSGRIDVSWISLLVHCDDQQMATLLRNVMEVGSMQYALVIREVFRARVHDIARVAPAVHPMPTVASPTGLRTSAARGSRAEPWSP